MDEDCPERKAMELEFPGFRFHPTEEELLEFYLKRVSCGIKLHLDIIGTLDIYRYDPWELPGLAKIGEREWYFFVPRGKKQSIGGRPRRTTLKGFWKATGPSRTIRSVSYPRSIIGLKKTLVFYTGRAPRGVKTDWIMNEYFLPDNSSLHKEEIVLCKVYRKAKSMKVLEQRAAAVIEEFNSSSSSHPDTPSSTEQDNNLKDDIFCEEIVTENGRQIQLSSLQICSPKMELTDLQIPMFNTSYFQDPFLYPQIISPCFPESLGPYLIYPSF